MQKRTKFAITLLALGFAIAMGAVAFKADQPRPSCLGRSVSYWLTDGFTLPPGFEGRPPAESAFRSLGSNAVPFLIATLGKTDGPLRRAYCRCYPKLPGRIKKKLPRPDSADELRGRAILALAIIGPSAKAAIPSLFIVLANDTNALHRANAVRCLDALDNTYGQEAVVDAWLRARSDPDPVVAAEATNILSRRFPLGVFPLDGVDMSFSGESDNKTKRGYKK